MLGELSEALRGVFIARGEALERTGDWDALSAYHPSVEAVRSIVYRIRLVASAVDDEELRGKVDMVARLARLASVAMAEEEAKRTRDAMTRDYYEAVELLGEQLRRLP